MKHIYIFDCYSPSRNTGVDTYVAHLTQAIRDRTNALIYFVWTESTISQEIKEEYTNGVSHIYLPGDDPVFGKKGKEREDNIVSFFRKKTHKQMEIFFSFQLDNPSSFISFVKKTPSVL